MRAIVGGILAAFVYFHTPDGGVVAVDPANEAVIIRPAPPGFKGHAMIEINSGKIVVEETVCQVAHALERSCPAKGPQ